MRLTRKHIVTTLLTIGIVVTVMFVSAAIARAALPEVLRHQQPNICRVEASDGSRGSGCYLGGCLILTADHVTNDSQTGTVDFFGGGEYKYRVVGRSKEFDASYLRIERPVEASIRGVRIGVTPKKGEYVWKAGYGKSPAKLYWHRGKVVSVTTNGRIGVTPYSISGDSGGPVFTLDGRLIGCLQTTNIGSNRTYANTVETTVRSLGAFTKDLIDVELSLVADACPGNGQLGGGLLGGRFGLLGGSENDPNAAPRAPGGVPAETTPNADSTLVSTQFAILQEEAAKAVQAAQEEAAKAREAAEGAAAKLDEQRKQAEEEASEREKQAIEEKLVSIEQNAITNEANTATHWTTALERWLPWIILLIIVIYLLWKNYQQTGAVTAEDVEKAVEKARPIAEPLAQDIMAAIKPPPMPAVADPKPPMPHSVAARAAASKVREAKAVAAEEEARAKTEIARASEDAQRDVDAIAEAAKELDD